MPLEEVEGMEAEGGVPVLVVKELAAAEDGSVEERLGSKEVSAAKPIR